MKTKLFTLLKAVILIPLFFIYSTSIYAQSDSTCIDSLDIHCIKMQPNQGYNVEVWSLSFNYTGSNGSTLFVTPMHSWCVVEFANIINNGYNKDGALEVTFDFLDYTYDTILISVIDSATGDTCSASVALYIDNNSAYYFPNCDAADYTATPGQVQCVAMDPSTGLPAYIAYLTINNSTDVPAIIIMPNCPNCNNNESNGGMAMPGSTSDMVLFEPDSATQDSVTFIYLVLDTNACSICQVPINIPIPALGTLQFTAGDTVLCTGATSCYQASASNSQSIYYAIDTGGADIDSLTGCVSNVTSSFRVMAIAQGVFECVVDTAYLHVLVPVVSAPTITPIDSSGRAYNDGIICSGASAWLESSSATTYQWTSGDTSRIAGPLTPDSNTIYTVTITSANNCQNSSSYTLTVTPLPNSLIPWQQDTMVCAGTSTNIFIPTSQSGTRYDLMVAETVIASGYGDDATITLNTGAINGYTIFYVMATDTATGCNILLNSYLIVQAEIVSPPAPPAPKSVNSSTAHTFNFVNLNPGNNGNQLVWALDSNFTTSHYMSCFDTIIGGKDTSSCAISVTVSPNSDTMIWLKSIDSTTGCASNASITIAIVANIYQVAPLNLDTIILVCAGSTTNIPILHSSDTFFYALRIDTSIISAGLGNGATLYLGTDTVNSSTIFNILSTDTATGDTATLAFGILVQPVGPVDSNVIIEGDTFVYTGDTVYYTAVANNGVQTIYSISDGNATINASTGCVTNILGDFSVQAVVYGPTGCSSATGYLYVHTTPVGAPIAPLPITVYIDSPTAVTSVSFYNVTAGAYGNEIEWATNKDFTGSTIAASPANITVNVTGVQTEKIYIRSVSVGDPGLGNSQSVESSLSTTYPTISAGLLDKTNWVLDPTRSDEFNYAVGDPGGLSVQYPDGQYIKSTGFLKKWNLVLPWSINADGTADYYNCINYNAGPINSNVYSLCDWGNCPLNPKGTCGEIPGSGHEVWFSDDGVVHLSVKKLSNPVPDSVCLDCQSNPNCTTSCGPATIYYQRGWLSSVKTFPLLNSMWEIRFRLSADAPDLCQTFWNNGTNGNLNMMDVLCTSTNMNSTIQDNSFGSATSAGPFFTISDGECGITTNKQTACGYDQEWHTMTGVTTPTEFIYFIDGKEAWSTNVTSPAIATSNGYWPTGAAPADNNPNPITFPIFIGTNIYSGLPSWEEADFQVDYFRYYTPATSGYTNCFQNMNYSGNWTSDNYDGQNFSGSQPLTLESLSNPQIPVINTPASNNNRIGITNNKLCNTCNGYSTPIAGTNLAFDPNGLQKIYYQGNDGQLRNAYLNGGQWWEFPLGNDYAQVNDVDGGIVVYIDRVFYISTNNKLKFFQWINNLGTFINVDAKASIDCLRPEFVGVNLSVDEFGRVWFIGADNNVYAWVPNGTSTGQDGILTGQTVKITSDNSAAMDLTVHSCGCLIFYGDVTGHVVQHSWWNVWSAPVIVSNNSNPVYPLAAIALDENNSKLYFMGACTSEYVNDYTGPSPSYTDPDVYSYNIQYGATSPQNSQKLGFTSNCTEYDNAIPWLYNDQYTMSSVLAVSPDPTGTSIYYLGADGNIWYYFNDKDHAPQNYNYPVSPNWFRALLTNNQDAGMLTVQPSTGQIFYVDASGYLNTLDWETADNLISCPNAGYTHEDYNAALRSEPVENTTDASVVLNKPNFSIKVFPNPSTNNFTFLVSGLPQNVQMDIAVFDLNGRQLADVKNYVSLGTSGSVVWDAANIQQGVYYYCAQTTDGKICSGKLVKL